MKILYVNNSPADALVLRRQMAGAGNSFTSLVPGNGSEDEILDYLESNLSSLPDAILLDVRSQLVNPVEVLRAVRERPEFGMVRIFLVAGSGECIESAKSINKRKIFHGSARHQ